MHISEGILSVPVLAGGSILAAGGLAWSLKRLPWSNIMSVGIFSAAFFVASLIHIPIGPGSAHLLMNGLIGAVLGWAALPAIAVALFLQALLFQFGGLTTLGVNICIMGFPAVFCGILFRPFFQPSGHNTPPQPKEKRNPVRFCAAFACAALAVMGSALLCAAALFLSGDAFIATAWAILAAHIPIALIEGFLTIVVVEYLAKALPELFSIRKDSRDI